MPKQPHEKIIVHDEYVTAQAVIDELGITYPTLMDWRRYRGLPVHVFPAETQDAVRFDLKEVLAWAADNKINIPNAGNHA